jgi:hypothetical protein
MSGLAKTIIKYFHPNLGIAQNPSYYIYYHQVFKFQYFTIRLPVGEKFH